jgi:mRNA interferase MazF
VSPGDIVLVQLDPAVGNELGGARPALVVSSEGYARLVADQLVVVCPITSRDRSLLHHVALTPAPSHRLDRPSWVMCEQPRTVSTRRVTRTLGAVTPADLARVATIVHRMVYSPGGDHVS